MKKRLQPRRSDASPPGRTPRRRPGPGGEAEKPRPVGELRVHQVELETQHQELRKVAERERLVEELRVHQVELETQNEELRTARTSLEAALERYTQLFDFAPIGYFSVNASGFIREVNLAGARFLGVPRKHLVGQNLLAFVAADRQPDLQRFLVRVLSDPTARGRSCEVTLHGEGGRRVEVHLTATAMEGASPTALIAVEDISVRVHAERELREEAARKDEFLAVLSHELRNPLAPIRNSLGVLEQGAQGEQARRAHEVIGRQVAQLTRLVEDLLDVTRITRGKVHLHRERLELGELVRRVLEDHRESFAVSGILLADRLEPGPFWVDADPARLVQVLGNLLANAEKFTERGGRVDVVLRSVNGNVILRVRDSGVGLTPELLPSLFKPFVQAPQAADRPAGGVGLGLAMVKGLVALHGGTVEAASGGAGHGSTFTVRLPLVSAPTESAFPPRTLRASPSRRVLIIDDNQDSTDSLRELLALQGHDVRVAYDGPRGVALAKVFRPDVVLCDIGLPGMDGYQVALALRADEATKDVYLVALSGYALPDDLRHASEAGFDKHVAKPPGLDELGELLARLPRRAVQEGSPGPDGKPRN